jgi:cytochrome P450
MTTLPDADRETQPVGALQLPAGFEESGVQLVYQMLDAMNFAHLPFPVDTYDQWRAETPIIQGDRHEFPEGFSVPHIFDIDTNPSFMTLTYDASREVFLDAERFATAFFGLGERSFVHMDGAPHRRFRVLLQKGLSPKSVQYWEDVMMKPLVHQLVDGFCSEGRAELRSMLTQPLPGQAIGAVLGVPPGDLSAFNILGMLQFIAPISDVGAQAVQMLTDYFDRHIAHRRSLDPEELAAQEDIISLLVAAREGDDSLSDGEINGALHFLLAGGGESSNRALSSAVYFLLTTPGMLDAVSADRSLIPAVIDETLRLTPPGCMLPRRANIDCDVAGVAIPKGSFVVVNVSSANRDPAAWEEPNFFMLRRSRLPHLAFGQGAHICPGLHLAKLEVKIALNVLLDRCSNLRLDPAEPLPELRGRGFVAPDALAVLFDEGSAYGAVA